MSHSSCSLREAGRRSRPPTPELRCPRGLPGPPQPELRPTQRNRRRFPRASQASPFKPTCSARFLLPQSPRSWEDKGYQKGREDYTRQGAGDVEGNGIREGSLTGSVRPRAHAGLHLALLDPILEEPRIFRSKTGSRFGSNSRQSCQGAKSEQESTHPHPAGFQIAIFPIIYSQNPNCSQGPSSISPTPLKLPACTHLYQERSLCSPP